jgi:hypothetical protein
MSLLLKGGISKLSELEIDADKDWQARGISNIREIAAGMAIGDIVQHDGVKLVRLPAGLANYVLTSQGALHLVTWAPGGTYFERYLPVSIDGAHAEGVVSPIAILKSVPIAVGLNYPAATKQPSLGSSRFVGVITPADIAKAASPARQLINERTYPVSCAVADDGGVQTDETAAANEDTANDMTLLPAVPALNDAYYFAYGATFERIRLNQETRGVGTWTVVWEYWNGSGWPGLSGVDDPTSGFRPASADTYKISWTVPGDWATTTVAGLGPYYWVRARVTAYTSVTTQPKGTRAWIYQTL